MDHVAIMNKSFGDLPRRQAGLIAKILSGEKKIESRWSINRVMPWSKVLPGDRVYFKNAGEKVTAIAEVEKVLQFENLDREKVRSLLEKWGGADGIAISSLEGTIEWAKRKRYCVLIFLKNPRKIEPFEIDKTGFGSGAAWIRVQKIKTIKI